MGWNPARAWTRQHPVGGYRHFQLVLQGGRGDQRWVELAAVLAPGFRERVLWSDFKGSPPLGEWLAVHSREPCGSCS
ncbi:tryptophan-rich conserved hypothetical protein CHP02450 [Synechococcus sp. A18-46.1]|nr:tryptophan-rich conserved hypothetical protein CHP02450 [Synechococcus sp. A18-46.1]